MKSPSNKENIIIKSVWNDSENELYRQDQSHWRGVGRWADDDAWKNIGKKSRNRLETIWNALGRQPSTLSNLSILEWGPGGGANAFGLRGVASKYYGVDISEKNLSETSRLMKEEGFHDYFCPILIDNDLSIISKHVKSVDVFLSTAVFQHFPSKEYGKNVIKAIKSVCSRDAVGFIQIRFDNGNEKYRGIENIEQYRDRHITANSYSLDNFWDTIAESGFLPISINDVSTNNNYATFFIKNN